MLTTMNRLLDRFIFAVVLGSMGLGFVFSSVLGPIQWAVPILFGFMTFVTSLGCSWRDFARVLRAPAPIFICLLLLHAVHPLFARVLGWGVYGADSPFAVALILGTAVPVGVTSVIWSGLVKGDVPLSLAVVTTDTMLAPILVPLTILVFAGQSIKFDVQAMMSGLAVMIVIPAVVGVSFNDIMPVAVRKLKHYISPASKLSLGAVIAINVAAAKGQFASLGPSWAVVLLVIAVQCGFGYASSWWCARLARVDEAVARTITFSAGMRNISAGIVIAMAYFEPSVAVPVVLSMLFQQPFATVASRLLTRGMTMSDGKGEKSAA